MKFYCTFLDEQFELKGYRNNQGHRVQPLVPSGRNDPKDLNSWIDSNKQTYINRKKINFWVITIEDNEIPMPLIDKFWYVL